MKICRVATVPYQINQFLREQIIASLNAGHEILIITSPSDDVADFCAQHGVSFIPVPMERRMALWRDLVSLVRLVYVLYRSKPDVVHSISSKAGFLTAIAAWMLRIPVRLHVFAGLPWLGMNGVVRIIGMACDKLIVRLSHRCYADSVSEAKVLEEHGVASQGEVVILGEGSVAGIDLARFDPSKYGDQREQVLTSCAVPFDAQVIAFVGRVTREKGIAELAGAFTLLAERFPSLYLLIVGPIDHDVDPVPQAAMKVLQTHPRVRFLGYQQSPEIYLATAEILVIPSYREGFCNVVIEAASLGVPAVGARVMGLVDSIVHGETGVLVEAKTVKPLAGAVEALLKDAVYRKRLGDRASSRAHRHFDQNYVNGLVVCEYMLMLSHVNLTAASEF